MGNNFRTYSPRQSFLLPPSPMEWLPEGHLAFFILEVVEALDLSVIESVYAGKDARGERPYAPRMMLGLLVYGYCVGVFSSRKLAKATYEDVSFRVLCGGEHPHFTRISGFRLEHRDALGSLFVQVLKLCDRAGLIKLGHVALDGTKIQASASKHKAMSYERMGKEEAKLRSEVEALLSRAESADHSEDVRFGAGQDEEDLPEELRRRESRLARIQAAKTELEAEAKVAQAEHLRKLAAAGEEKSRDTHLNATDRKLAATGAKKAKAKAKTFDGKDDDDFKGGGVEELPLFRTHSKPDGTPTPQSQRNFTDADSRLMVTGGAFIQAYNSQAVVDAHAQVIVAAAVSNQAADIHYLAPMLAMTKLHMGSVPQKVSADSGYFSAANAAYCSENGVDAYLATGRKKGAARPASTQNTPANVAKEKMAEKLATSDGKQVYSRRKVIVEPVFGQIKEARGFRRFSMRGLEKVRCEWNLVCATHNLLKLFRAGFSPAHA